MKILPYVLVSAVLLAGGLFTPALAECDPHAKQLDATRQLIIVGNFPEAIRQLNVVLKADPQDFRANYQLGQAIAEQADVHDFNSLEISRELNRGLDILKDTSKRIGSIDLACAKRLNFYNIYAAIGTEYLRRKHYDDAIAYFLKGYGAIDNLDAAGKILVLDYLGQAYLLKRDFANAYVFLTKAAAAGSTTAAGQMEIAEKLGEVYRQSGPVLAASAANPNLTGSDPHWLADAAHKCWAFLPDPSGATITWAGACKQNLASGPGTLTLMRNGKPSETRTGNFTGGVLNGQGTGTQVDGGSYDGNWQLTRHQGFGRFKTAQGDLYEGFWPGDGRYTRHDGKICKGTVKERISLGRDELTFGGCR